MRKTKLLLITLLTSSVFAGKFYIGDSVIVFFGSTYKYNCNAVIIIEGKKQSKVEYIGYCRSGLIDSKSSGQTEWVPNRVIYSRVTK